MQQSPSTETTKNSVSPPEDLLLTLVKQELGSSTVFRASLFHSKMHFKPIYTDQFTLTLQSTISVNETSLPFRLIGKSSYVFSWEN